MLSKIRLRGFLQTFLFTVQYPVHVKQICLRMKFLRRVAHSTAGSNLYEIQSKQYIPSQRQTRFWLRIALKSVPPYLNLIWSPVPLQDEALMKLRNPQLVLLRLQLELQLEKYICERMVNRTSNPTHAKTGLLFELPAAPCMHSCALFANIHSSSENRNRKMAAYLSRKPQVYRL